MKRKLPPHPHFLMTLSIENVPSLIKKLEINEAKFLQGVSHLDASVMPVLGISGDL